jgi:hypothetical protein
MVKNKRRRMRPEIIILIMAIALFAFLSISLFREKRYQPMTGCLILLCIFLFFTFISLPLRLPQIKNPIKSKRKRDIISEGSISMGDIRGDDLVQLISTKNCIRAHAIKNALIDDNINCVVLDQHSTRMMFYLPDVEMRIMVPKKDLKNSMAIIKNMEIEED